MNVWDFLVYGAALTIGFYATKTLLGNEVENLIAKKA
tara:strand:+ start:764 stop:874 length:111 start_codon:yes stop_codon:yes gene_type:complete